MSLLSADRVKEEIEQLINWELFEDSEIRCSIELKNFKQSMFLVNAIAYESEKMNHHPDIAISWNRIELRLTTHDSNGLTEKDFSLAKTINSLL